MGGQTKEISETSVAAKDFSMQPQPEQNIGNAGPPNFLRRLSSTFKHKPKSAHKHLAGARNSVAEREIKKATPLHSPQESQSTPGSQKKISRERTQITAADTLRKRLRSELRFSSSANSHHEIQVNPQAGGSHPEEAATKSQGREGGNQSPMIDIQRRPTLWDVENPFEASKAKDVGRSGAAGHTPHEGNDRNLGKRERDEFSNVALTHVTYSPDVLPHKCSAFQYSQPSTTSGSLRAESGNLMEDASGNNKKESDESGSSDFVVVANATCELTHPRPSRSSDKMMIKELCKSGRKTAEDQDDSLGESMWGEYFQF
ncbi:hypothetical protein Daus18300_002135 [Diaporthe australafricana]|uniref:Uncharacterized protein n=1 Tax=Diaporthe australafricana TaxID=127596 RepID=A0ABR3XRI2_9PEZI